MGGMYARRATRSHGPVLHVIDPVLVGLGVLFRLVLLHSLAGVQGGYSLSANTSSTIDSGWILR